MTLGQSTPTLFTTGDTAPDLSGTVNTDLTGATLELHLKPYGGDVLTVTATATDATNGAWSYTWAAGDLATYGTWMCELQVTYSDGRIQTFGPASFKVAEQIA